MKGTPLAPFDSSKKNAKATKGLNGFQAIKETKTSSNTESGFTVMLLRCV